MKYRNLFTFLLLFQQFTIQSKSSVANYVTSFFSPTEIAQKVIQKEYTNVNSLEITQTVGNIEVQSWKHKTVAIEVVHSGTEEFLEEAHILVQNFNGKLVVMNKLKPTEKSKTELHILVPENASITINSNKGNISIYQSNGALRLYTEIGDITVSDGTNDLIAKSSAGNIFAWRKETKPNKKIELTAEKGDVYLYTTPASNFDVNAQSLSGKIRSAVPLTLHPVTLEINSKSIAEFEHKFLGFFGKPLSKTKLFCYTGNINIEPYI